MKTLAMGKKLPSNFCSLTYRFHGSVFFEYNAQRFGDEWPVHVGLTRLYAYQGNIPKALEHAKKALTQAPDDLNRKSLEAMVKTFSEGKNIQQ